MEIIDDIKALEMKKRLDILVEAGVLNESEMETARKKIAEKYIADL